MWNTGTYGFYCDHCAYEINKWSRGEPLCVEVDGRKPTIEEMDLMRRSNLEKNQKRTYAENAKLYAAEQVYEISMSEYTFDDYRPSKKALKQPPPKVIDNVRHRPKKPSAALKHLLKQKGRK
jgi:hypothetical protein